MPLSDNMRGALLMMAAMASFTVNDALMKTLAGVIPLFQLLFLRGLLTSTFNGVWAWRAGAMHLRIPKRDKQFLALRVVGEIGAAYFFLTALFNMPLANVTSILQSVPLTVSLAAALFFGERIGWRRLSAILLGFVGVLLIVRPGAEGFTVYSIYVLIAVLFVTLRDLSTRRLSGETHSLFVTWATSAAVMAFFGFASLTQGWFSVMAMRAGEVSFVAPFRYTGLIWALVLGWAVFGDWPQPPTLIGAAIVVGSGIFMLYREGQLARRTRRGR